MTKRTLVAWSRSRRGRGSSIGCASHSRCPSRRDRRARCRPAGASAKRARPRHKRNAERRHGCATDHEPHELGEHRAAFRCQVESINITVELNLCGGCLPFKVWRLQRERWGKARTRSQCTRAGLARASLEIDRAADVARPFLLVHLQQLEQHPLLRSQRYRRQYADDAGPRAAARAGLVRPPPIPDEPALSARTSTGRGWWICRSRD